MSNFSESNIKPKTIIRQRNFIVLNWENIFESNVTCKLQILNDLKEWKTVFWGKKKQFKVENLTPCTCYDFRIKPETEVVEWLYFKTATDVGPYLPMHMTRAVLLAKTALIRQIVHSRTDLLEIENKESKTPLVQAVEKGDLQVLLLLLNLGANVNTPLRYNGRTPLMISVYRGQLQLASVLIDKGADKNATDINNLNVLHYAVDSNNAENVKFALQIGVDVNSKDSKGWTPLLRAAILKCCNQIINLLLDEGADKTIKDKNGLDFKEHMNLN